VLPFLLWAAMFANLDTGFWMIKVPGDGKELLLCVRAILPLVVLPVAIIVLMGRKASAAPFWWPSKLLFIYGLVVTIASAYSPLPLWSLYWSVAFLATILAAWSFIGRRNSVDSARLMLYATWAATFAVATILGIRASPLIFGKSHTAYGVLTQLDGLSRSSGVARWAAVPGLVCIIRAFHTRKVALFVFYLSAAAVAFYIVYRMQSRGAVFGAVGALTFILLHSSRMRRYALPFAVATIIGVVLIETPEVVSAKVTEYLLRGQNEQQFLSMTGRTYTYAQGIQAFKDAPIFGRGQWADRMLLYQHVHNSYLQAMMNGGTVGTIPYLASWITGWVLFFRVQKKRLRLVALDRVSVLECGAVMMFFSIRAIPETTTASFAVDLLIMVAVYVYLEVLAISLKRRPVLRAVPMQFYPFVPESADPLPKVG
jgi:O-antigen ligase